MPNRLSSRLSGFASRLLLIPLAGIVFAAAMGAGYQWGAPEQAAVVRVFDSQTQPRIGSDGAPTGDLRGFVSERTPDAWIVRVGDQQRRISFHEGSTVEALLPIWTDAVSVGDYVIVGGTDDNVNTFVTTGIVVIPAETALRGDDVEAAIRADAER